MTNASFIPHKACSTELCFSHYVCYYEILRVVTFMYKIQKPTLLKKVIAGKTR